MLSKPKNIPTFSGVYIFNNRAGRPIYIGKAANLKKRLAFYFRKKAASLRPRQGYGGQARLKKLLDESSRLKLIKTESEIEALIKEAALIKKFRPKYNILMRDDKNYIFVAVTEENFPKMVITHQPKLFQNNYKIIGPFTDTTSLKTTFRLLRKALPYCTCVKPHKRPCLNAELGKCPGFCCYKSKAQISNRPPSLKLWRAGKLQTEYAKNIRAIISILEGKKISAFMRELGKDLKDAVRALEYERAAKIRDQLFALEKILNHRSVISNTTYLSTSNWPALERKISTLLKSGFNNRDKTSLHRVEGYDISNISGTSATGSMIVFIDGLPEKNEYRKFKIRTILGSNDIAMLAEVIVRRFRHPEWAIPDLIVLDGGKPQLNMIIKTARESGILNHESKKPLITALAKRDEELYVQNRRNLIQLKSQPAEVLHFFQRVRDEAHRFAKNYHHKLRKRYLGEN